jgi:hypothetical protein
LSRIAVPGLVPGIHVSFDARTTMGMAGTSPAMTAIMLF